MPFYLGHNTTLPFPGSSLIAEARIVASHMVGWTANGSLLGRSSVERRGLLNWAVVEETVALHEASKEDHTDHLLSLINLEVWARMYLDGRSSEDVALELASVAGA